MTSLMTETNQAGAPAVPGGMRNHSKSPLGVQRQSGEKYPDGLLTE